MVITPPIPPEGGLILRMSSKSSNIRSLGPLQGASREATGGFLSLLGASREAAGGFLPLQGGGDTVQGVKTVG